MWWSTWVDQPANNASNFSTTEKEPSTFEYESNENLHVMYR